MERKTKMFLWLMLLFVYVCSLFYVYFVYESYPEESRQIEFLPSDLAFITGRFYYTNKGKGGMDNDLLWISVNGSVDKGQIMYLEFPTYYGTYQWEGFYHGGNDSGWGLQGLVDMDVSKYVAFENLYQENRLRCITYNKSYTTSQYEPEEQTNVSKPIEGWHTFKIIWTHSYVEFYINDELVATHTEVIPIEPLYFHQQVCVGTWMNETSKLTVMMKDVHIKSDYLPFYP